MLKVPNEDGFVGGNADHRLVAVDDNGFSIYPFDAWLRMRGVNDTVEAPVEEVL